MTSRLPLLALPILLPALGALTTLHAQDGCKNLQPGAAVQDTSGCFPLTYKPADGGPVQTVWVPGTFIGPVQRTNAFTKAAAVKTRTLDFGLMGYFTDPDYGHGSNVDVGAFVSYTGKFFGVEIDGGDTVRHTGGIRESYLVAGPRLQYKARHFTLYAKAQAGAGHFNGDKAQPTLSRNTFLVENYGGGLEFGLSRHLKIRAVDANYEIWPSFANNRLTPFHVGSGVVFSF